MNYLSVTSRLACWGAGRQVWAAAVGRPQSGERAVASRPGLHREPTHPSLGEEGRLWGVCAPGAEVPKISLSMLSHLHPPPQLGPEGRQPCTGGHCSGWQRRRAELEGIGSGHRWAFPCSPVWLGR